MNLSESTRLVAVLKANWPNHPVQQETPMAYHLGLDDVPYEAAMAAARAAIRTSKFFPTVAELRSLLSEQLLGIPSGEEAWGQVMRAIRAHGSYGAPQFGDGPLADAVQSLGWREICLCQMSDLPTLRSQFFRVYEAYRQRTVKDADLAALWSGDGRAELPPVTTGPWWDPVTEETT